MRGTRLAGALSSGSQTLDTADQAMVWGNVGAPRRAEGGLENHLAEAPWDENEGWALYNIKDDPAEAQDLVYSILKFWLIC